MIVPPLRIEGHCEARKVAFRQTKEGTVISFLLHPNDVSADLAAAPLGTILMLGYAEVIEGQEPAVASPEAVEQPKERKRFDELPLPQQAALLCQDERFQKWCSVQGAWFFPSDEHDMEKSAAEWLRSECGVKSRSELSEGGWAAEKFGLVISRYRRDCGLETWRP